MNRIRSLLCGAIGLSLLLGSDRATAQTDFWQQTNGAFFGATVYTVATKNNGVVFAGTERGVFRSKDNGETWKDVSSGVSLLGSTEVNSLFILPNGNILASTFFGVYLSTNEGDNWSQTASPATEVNSFARNLKNGDLYAAVGFGLNGGLYRSTNNGASWVLTGLNGPFVYSVASTSAGIIFAGTNNGVYRSADDGLTWTLLNTGFPTSTSIRAFAINDSSGTLLVGTSRGIFRSSNNGVNWVATTVTNVTCYSIAVDSKRHFYVATASGIMRSSDDGTSWASSNTGLTSSRVYSITATASDQLFAGTDISIFRSTNAGNNWQEIKKGLGIAAVAALALNNTNGYVFAGTDRTNLGLFRSTDNGANWKAVNNGLTAPAISAIVVSPNGHVLASATYDRVFRSTDNGDNWAETGFQQQINAFAINRTNGYIFAAAGYSALNGVFRSIDNGYNWTATTLSGMNVFTVAATANGTIFAGTNSGIFRSTDNGDSWVLTYTGMPSNTTVLALAVNDASGTLLAGTALRGIFRSVNNGNSWQATSVTNVTVNALASNTVGNFFAGTEQGCYRTLDDGVSWAALNSGLTVSSIRALAINNKNMIFAGTNGGGVFQGQSGPLSATPTIQPEVAATHEIGAEFSVDIKVNDVQNLFGLSFDLNFTNTAQVDYVSASAGEFVGNDVVFLPTPDDANGRVSIGLSRKAGQSGVSGSGAAVRVKFKSLATTPSGTTIIFSLLNVTANDPSGAPLNLTAQSDTTRIIGVTVWPGDTNNDRLVDAKDVLPLGLHWSKTGPARANATTAWQAQSAVPWSPEGATYADASGDGTIDSRDVLPIGLNWNKTHGAPNLVINNHAPRAFAKTNAAGLCYKIIGATTPGSEFEVEVYAIDATNLFGLAFDLSYSPVAFIEPQNPAVGNFMGNDLVFFPNVDKTTGVISVGVSQKPPLQGANGSGVIARIKMRMAANAPAQQTVAITLQNTTANDANGAALAVTPTGACATTAVEEFTHNDNAPARFALLANSPNPFNPSTTIKYELAQQVDVELKIFDLMGHHVRTLVQQSQQAGRYAITWDGRNESGQSIASGVYIYQLRAGTFAQTRRMALVR